MAIEILRSPPLQHSLKDDVAQLRSLRILELDHASLQEPREDQEGFVLTHRAGLEDRVDAPLPVHARQDEALLRIESHLGELRHLDLEHWDFVGVMIRGKLLL